jgi:hypothetical protein
LLAAGKKVLSWKLIPLKMKKDCKSMTKTKTKETQNKQKKGKYRDPAETNETVNMNETKS